MHEIGVLYEIVKTAERVAIENNASSVSFITIEVGELSGYLPIFFEQYFSIVTEDKELFKDCDLRIIQETGEGLCTDCNSLYNIMRHEGQCPKCGSRNKTVLSGQKLLIREIGIPD